MSRGAVSGPGQLVLRHGARIAQPGLLILNAPGDGVLGELEALGATGSRAIVWRDSAGSGSGLAPETTFKLLAQPLCKAVDRPAALLFIPREKALARLALRDLAASLSANGTLWVVGDNRAGGKSADRLLKPLFRKVRKLDAARHCSLFEATSPSPATPLSLDDEARQFTVTVADVSVMLTGLPGVFSAGTLDDATRLLLEKLPEPAGRVLDFGCGCGVIGTYLARKYPGLDVTLLDDFVFAVEASRRTLAANGVEAQVLLSDGLAHAPDGFDWIISNPPFHQGVETDYSVPVQLIAGAAEHLDPGGRLVIVANQFLDYEQRMAQAFGNCEVLSANRRFRVYCSQRA